MSPFSLQAILSETKQSLRLSMPLLVAQLVQSLAPFVSTIIIAQLGKNALAAGALVSALYLTVVVFMFGLLGSVGVLVAQSFGAKDDKGVRLATSQGLLLSVLLSIPMTLGLWLTPLFLGQLEHDAAIVALATPYLHSLSYTVLPLAFLVTMEQYLIAINHTRLVLWVSLMEVPAEIFFIYALVFGKFGFPNLGIAGAGYGFAIVYVLTMIIMGLFIVFSKDYKKYRVFSNFCKYHGTYLWELVKIGWPIGLMYIIELVIFSVIAFMMGYFGSEQLAAYQILWQYLGLTVTIIFAISQVATVRVGQAVGARNQEGILIASLVNMAICLCFMVVVAFIYIAFPRAVIGLDIDLSNPAYTKVINYTVTFLAIGAVYQLIDNFRLIAVGSLRGLKDTRIPMIVSFVIFWLIGLPCAYVFAFRLGMTGAGLWLGLVVGNAIGAIYLVYRIVRLAKKNQLQPVIS